MNTLKGTHVEFHILQSFPVSCLNRDEVGAPKSAMIGGVSRARVSSQCWKRHVRLAMHDLGVKLGVRTKQVAEMIEKACIAHGADPDQAKAFGTECGRMLAGDNTLYFFSAGEAEAIARFAASNAFDPGSVSVKKSGKVVLSPELKKTHKDHFKPAVDGLDIALFGRMVAQAPDLNVRAAASFAHAISTHRVDNEIEFFTALDDLKAEDEAGSAHMGSLEFNSATYYRYVNLDLGQLAESLGNAGLADAVAAFIKALYLAVPSARQTTQTGLRPWDYARIYIRKGQGMQASFDEPIKAKGQGFLKPSVDALESQLARQEKLAGSLFGKVAEYTFGKDDTVSIDDVVSGIADYVRQFEAQA